MRPPLFAVVLVALLIGAVLALVVIAAGGCA